MTLMLISLFAAVCKLIQSIMPDFNLIPLIFLFSVGCGFRIENNIIKYMEEKK